MLALFPGSHVWDIGTSLIPCEELQYEGKIIIVFGVSFLC